LISKSIPKARLEVTQQKTHNTIYYNDIITFKP